MTIDLDEAKDRAERGELLTRRHGEALLAELNRLREELRSHEGGTKLLERQISRCYVDALREIEQFKLRLGNYDERERLVEQLLEQIALESPEYASRTTEVLACAVRDFKVKP